MQPYIYPEGPKETIEMIQCVRFIEEFMELVREVLEKHTVRLEVLPDHCVLHFPPGTIRQVQYPAVLTDRYTITLPDSFVLYESTSIRPNGLSSVRLALDEFPTWVQEKYRRK